MDKRKSKQVPAGMEIDQKHIAFPDRLKRMLDVSNRLAGASSVDSLCQMAIDLGRSELGFDRLGIWFRSNEDPDTILGSYGTDEAGHIRDEHGHTVKINSDQYLQEILSSKQATVLRRKGELFNERMEVIGEGTWASAVMWDGSQVIGYVMMDNLLTRQDFDDYTCELLALFASTLGHLCSRKQMEEALKKSEQEYRMTINSMRDAIHVVNRDLEIVLVNDAFRIWLSELGQPNDIQAKVLHKAFPFLSSDVEAEYRNVFKTGEVLVTTEVITLNDEPIYTETYKIPIFEDNQVVRVITIVRDVCAQKKAEEALQRSEAQLRHSQKMEALGRLAGGIAHDFNNLLTTILGYSQLALDSLSFDDALHADLSEVVRAGTRAAELTSRLLSFGRKHASHAVPTDINQVVEETERLLQHTMGQHIELVTLLSSEPGIVIIDSGQLQQVIMNLAINARDAMPNGGRLAIETELFTVRRPNEIMRIDIPPDDYVRLSISDSGTGMSDTVCDHIFEPFFTTKDADKGSGLGLSIVYGIVTQSNGYIDVKSIPGKGTIFSLYFPRIIGIDPGETINIRRQLQHGTETILVVEDEDAVRKFAVNILKSLGYRVLQAGSGAEALLMFARHKDIDLVFADIIMPGMNGKELIDRLHEEGHKIKAVYASGFSGDLLKGHAQDQNIPLLQKPYGRDQLSFAIRQVLDGRNNEN